MGEIPAGAIKGVPFSNQPSQTRVLDEGMLVDLFVFCGILASFLDRISLSVPVQ